MKAESQSSERVRRSTPVDASSRSKLPRSLVSGWMRLYFVAVPALTTVFAGSKESWALGGFACLVGAGFVLSPPNLRVSRAIWMPLAGMLLAMLAAFLPVPASSFPAWRTALTENLGVALPGLRSLQPWVSFEDWQFVAIGVLWLTYCLGRNFGSNDRRWIIRGMVLCIASLAVVAMVLKSRHLHVPWWESYTQMEYYGPFPNRNHFSTLLAVGAVLAFTSAYDAYSNGRRSWLFYGALILPMFAAILVNTSRAGVILFFGGLGAWMATATFHKASVQRVAVFASILLILSTGFLIYGEHIIGRFLAKSSTDHLNVTGRMLLAGDALHLLSQNPAFGVGLGNFDAVFALTKNSVDSATRSLHPESDWLWFVDENGLLALGFALAALVGIVQRAGPFRTGESSGKRDRRLRNAAAICAFLVALHGMVDTPAHSLGIWTLIALLCGLALRPPQQCRGAEGEVRRSPFLFVAGLLCLAAGVNWLATAFAGTGLPSGSLARHIEQQARVLAAEGDDAGAVLRINRALAIRPLAFEDYFQRAGWLLDLGQPPQEALEDFGRTRYLEPQISLYCFREVQVWLDHRLPMYAFPALRDAMSRDRSQTQGFYTSVLDNIGPDPEARESMRLLATDSKLRLVFLAHAVPGVEFHQALQDLLDHDPKLQDLTKKERASLFRLWYERGDKAQLIALLGNERNYEWRTDGWLVMAEHQASQGDYRGAFQLALEHLPTPSGANLARADDVDQLRRSFLVNPADVSRGMRLFDALKAQAGQGAEALAILEKVAKLANAPPRVWYEEALLDAQEGDFGKAWQQIKTYLGHLPPSDPGNVEN